MFMERRRAASVPPPEERFMPRHRYLPGVAAATATVALLAAAPAPGGEPTVSRARVVAHFDLAKGQTPENIAWNRTAPRS